MFNSASYQTTKGWYIPVWSPRGMDHYSKVPSISQGNHMTFQGILCNHKELDTNDIRKVKELVKLRLETPLKKKDTGDPAQTVSSDKTRQSLRKKRKIEQKGKKEQKKRRTYLEVAVEGLPVAKKTKVEPKKESKPESADNSREACLVAQKILTAGGFVQMPEDMEKPRDKGYFIGEAQGNPMLRHAARMFTGQYPEALSPDVLRRVGSVHRRNFRIIQLKRVGHVLSLSGNVKLKDGTSFHFNGFSESFTLPMVASSVKEYSLQPGSKISPLKGKWIADHINNSASHDIYIKGTARYLRNLIRDPNYHGVVTISSGHEWHGTHIFFFRGYLIFCNRGGGCGNFPGIRVFRVPNRWLITSDIISGLIRRHAVNGAQWREKYNIPALMTKLGLKQVYYLKQRAQTTGNCTYVSTKCAVRALLALTHLIDQCGPKTIPSQYECWARAFDETKEQYKEWSRFDKNHVLEDFMKDIKFLEEEKSSLVSRKEFARIFRKVKTKISLKPEKYELLAQFFSDLEL